ncbi:hypothetical protein POM88_019098 [Heracleum sosnowskyi]|uniref:Uncharacterized protein n=1 Tax=Heracleum sosnowskyi TaxID=360622 RepID=A0AAD8IS98_9APIA|nr:hypothetical protein POM88_019098 [Heracleum sosnowskyi]
MDSTDDEATDRAVGCERPVKTRTKNTNKTLAGNNNGANEASRSETLGNQNVGNEAGRSENVGNQTAGNEAGRSQNVGNQTAGNEAGMSETVVGNQSSGTAKNVPTRTDNAGSQGGILSKKPRQYKKNTPLDYAEGPRDPTLLHLQSDHISKEVWRIGGGDALKCRCRNPNQASLPVLDHRMLPCYSFFKRANHH